jgi:hypothetical protein
MNKKFALSLSVLALFAACSDDKDTADDVASGGSSSGSGGKTSKGGTAGTLGAGAGGDVSIGHGGLTAMGGMAGEGGAAGGAGAPSIEGGSGGVFDTGGASGSGSGGVSAGGRVGTGGISGTGGAAPVISTDTCTGAEATPNDDRASATAYTLGTAYTACLQSTTDVDVYAFQVPADSRGGYVQVSVTDVGANGDVALDVYSAADNGKFHEVGTNTDGGSIYAFFNAKPGAKFYIPVTNYADVKSPNTYTFKATYTQVADVYEPNDGRLTAVPITVGTPVQAYMFAGWEYSTGIPEEDWQDWYKVDLATGNVDILLSITASDSDGSIVLYDSTGTQVASGGSNTDGSSVDLKHAVATAGTYYVKIEPYAAPVGTRGLTSTIPPYLKQPYTLTLTQ